MWDERTRAVMARETGIWRRRAEKAQVERDALSARCEDAERLRDRYRAEARDLHWKAANAESARDNALAERDTAEDERDALSAELSEARRQLAMMRGA